MSRVIQSGKVHVSLQNPAAKRWIITISGSGAQLPDLHGAVHAMHMQGHTVDWARTLSGDGKKIVDHVDDATLKSTQPVKVSTAIPPK